MRITITGSLLLLLLLGGCSDQLLSPVGVASGESTIYYSRSFSPTVADALYWRMPEGRLYSQFGVGMLASRPCKGTIAFYSSDGGAPGIYKMELGSGSYLVRSEDDPSQPIVPNSVALSADTSRIAYYTYGLYPTQSGLGALHILPGLRDSIDLYDMTPDFTTGYLASPEFSPDGRYLAFYGALYLGGNTMLNVIDMENPNATPLSVDAFYGAMQSSSIAWSPSGDSVFFSGLSTPASAYGINVLDVRSGEVSSLSYSSGVDLFPAPSPDGRSFAFVRVDATKGSYDIYISTLNGKLRRVTGSGTPKSFPEWSPDGTKLLFIESDPGRLDLHGNLNRLDLHTLQVDTLDQGAYRGFWQSTPATAGR